MSVDPIDDESGSFLVLVNAEERYRLWPTFADVPTGWRRAFAARPRRLSSHIEQNSTDKRPGTLGERLASGGDYEGKPTNSVNTTGRLVNTR
jgi:uncharacterized protein YbdZ (MbtH family)